MAKDHKQMSNTKARTEEQKRQSKEQMKQVWKKRKENNTPIAEYQFVLNQNKQLQSQINKLENQLLNSNSIDRDSIIENIFKMQTKIKQGSYVSQTELIDDLNLLLKSI
jgi:uncharacterized protein (DUF3084 family)